MRRPHPEKGGEQGQREMIFDEEVASSEEHLEEVGEGALRRCLNRSTKRLKEADRQAMKEDRQPGSISGTGIASQTL
jgi:hypothetical protein